MMADFPYYTMTECAAVLGINGGSVARTLRNEGIGVVDLGNAKAALKSEIDELATHYNPTRRPKIANRQPATSQPKPTEPKTAVSKNALQTKTTAVTMQDRRAKLKAAMEIIRRKQR